MLAMGAFADETKAVLDEAALRLTEGSDELAKLTADQKASDPQFERAESVVAYGHFVVNRADPEIAPTNMAAQVRDHAAQLRDGIPQLVQGQPANLAALIDTLLASLAQLRPRWDADLEQAVKDAALRYRQSLDPRMRALAAEVGQLEGRLSEVEESIVQKHTEHQQTVSEQIAGAQGKIETVKAELEQIEGRVDALISDQDTKFTDAQEERRKEFTQAINEASKELGEAKEVFEERRREAEQRLDEVGTEIAETAAALAGRATAFSHAEESDEQAKLAFRWTLFTIFLALLAAAVPIAAGILDTDQTPESIAGKVLIGLIVAGVAGYTASVARHHRQRAATARRLEVELNAFSPFVAPLERDDRDDLRSTIIWRFFGPPDSTTQESDADPRPGPRVFELLRRRRERRRDQTTGPSEGD
jgi:hypothetical protein